MSWLTNFVRPRIQALVNRTEVPDNLWEKCAQCNQMIFHRDLDANLKVCPHCGYHFRIDVHRRLGLLFDDGQYETFALPKVEADPLKFRDRKRYADRLKETQTRTSETDALIVARGTIGGTGIVIAAFNFDFMGGSMGTAVGEGIVMAARMAVQERLPFMIISASGGARMQEGVLSLMQLPRTIIAIDEVKEAGLPYLMLLTDPTTGGVSASFAMLGDIAIAEPGAIIGFAGARVIEETIREKLPAGFQRAEYLQEHGMIDMVVPRAELRSRLIQILQLIYPNGGVAEPNRLLGRRAIASV